MKKLLSLSSLGVLLLCLWLDGSWANGEDFNKAIAVERIPQIRAADLVGQNRYALIIGINDYLDPKIPDLKTCRDDAQAVYELLTDVSVGGIDRHNAYLLLEKEASTRNIKKHLTKLRHIPVKSTVFIYFSGHGAREADEAYWVTCDAEIDYLSASGLSNREIQAFLARIPADRMVVMLDCCFAAATVKGRKTADNDFSSFLNNFSGKGRAYLMAAGGKEEAVEVEELKRSLFTQYLVEGLEGCADNNPFGNQDGVVVLTELTNYIDRHVAERARIRGGIQKPVVRMEDVQEPSKFRLTVDAERMAQHRNKRKKEAQTREKRLARLRELYLDERITLAQHKLSKILLWTDRIYLDEPDRNLRAEFVLLSDGKLEPDKFQLAVNAILSPDQLTARLKHHSEQRTRLRQRPNGEYWYGESTFTNSIGMQFVKIRAGTGIMGSPLREKGRPHNEWPQHQVRMTKWFYVGQHEVTQDEYEEIMGYNPSKIRNAMLPVASISWFEANDFCEKLSQIEKGGRKYRLPTEAEWEYSCRAQTSTAFNSGHNGTRALTETCWCSHNGKLGRAGGPKPVGSLSPNNWGTYDMHGNVWEWTSDWFAAYSTGLQEDPQGPENGQLKVIRGGSWYDSPWSCRSAARVAVPPKTKDPALGFRVVLEVKNR